MAPFFRGYTIWFCSQRKLLRGATAVVPFLFLFMFFTMQQPRTSSSSSFLDSSNASPPSDTSESSQDVSHHQTSHWWYVGIFFLTITGIGIPPALFLIWYLQDDDKTKEDQPSLKKRLQHWQRYPGRCLGTFGVLLVATSLTYTNLSQYFSTPPTITIISSPEPQGQKLDYTLEAEITEGESVSVNDTSIEADSDGVFRQTYPFTAETLDFEIRATNNAGVSKQTTFSVSRDPIPKLAIDLLSAEDTEDANKSYELKIKAAHATEVFADGVPMQAQTGDTYVADLTLSGTRYTVNVTAKNNFETIEEKFWITRQETEAEKRESERRIAAAAEENRKDKIKEQFSTRDGSHRKLVKKLKANLHDPKSFDYIGTRYVDQGENIVIIMDYRARNAFGALRKRTITAIADIDGNILEMASE